MQCSVYIALSLDGFIARRDGGTDWLRAVERVGEDYGYQRFFDSVDTLVIGRNTYDLALGFDAWPYAGKRCIVLTHGGITPRHGEESFSGPASELGLRLAREGAKRVYVDGGGVIQQFVTADLVSDVTVSILPILLGDGVRLFAGTGNEVPLTWLRTSSFESGLVQIEYTTGRRSDG
jgi:dihydrofolate reductase